jgi:hypothetical protein
MVDLGRSSPKTGPVEQVSGLDSVPLIGRKGREHLVDKHQHGLSVAVRNEINAIPARKIPLVAHLSEPLS